MSIGSFETSEDNVTKKQTMCLTNIRICEQPVGGGGLGAEAQASLSVLTVRTGLECPKDNLRGLM